MTKIIVTGGSGFIGRYVIAELQRKGYEVDSWDIKDGNDIMRISATANQYDAMIHLAANLEILNVDPIKEMELNIKGTVRMLELCRKCKIPKFIFTSTADVYGEPFTVANGVAASQERDKPQPFWSYAASKVSAEAYVQQYERLYGIKTVIIRPSIVTGVGEWYGRFVTLSMGRIRENEPILVFDRGRQSRDFVSVEDVAHLICLATTKNFPTPEIFNAGSGERIEIYEMAHMILDSCHKMGIEYPYPCIRHLSPKVGEFGRKPHEQVNQLLYIDHALQVLKWKPVREIPDILTNELKWVMKMSDKEFKEWTRHPRY